MSGDNNDEAEKFVEQNKGNPLAYASCDGCVAIEAGGGGDCLFLSVALSQHYDETKKVWPRDDLKLLAEAARLRKEALKIICDPTTGRPKPIYGQILGEHLQPEKKLAALTDEENKVLDANTRSEDSWTYLRDDGTRTLGDEKDYCSRLSLTAANIKDQEFLRAEGKLKYSGQSQAIYAGSAEIYALAQVIGRNIQVWYPDKNQKGSFTLSATAAGIAEQAASLLGISQPHAIDLKKTPVSILNTGGYHYKALLPPGATTSQPLSPNPAASPGANPAASPASEKKKSFLSGLFRNSLHSPLLRTA